MSTATIPAGFGAVEGEDFTTAVLGPVAEGRPGVAVPVVVPSSEPAEPMPDTIEARVRRGALLLDATTPGWAEKVNLDRLAMEWCDACILGQVFGYFYDGCESVGFAEGSDSEDLDWMDHQAEPFGFILMRAAEDFDGCWNFLADAWRIEIRSRRPEGRG